MRPDDASGPGEFGRLGAGDRTPLDTSEWYAARDATTALRDVLTSAGLHRDFPYLRADMNAFGLGYVDLGRIAPHTAERVAELLRLGLATTAPQEGEPTT
ncbi:hypothetical protein AB0399_19620 [Streptomyces sp. NPDC088194]|uniref:hypothetical protein n=1 Tax=Streptomyces sp. NPDC088194 TaxID=3154931 RepID=UPI00344FD860